MFLHASTPGFQAAVHQAADATLRGRPVAVAVDAAPNAPLFAVSLEARRQGLWAGWRAGQAKRRCPRLRVCLPDPDLYRQARAALVRLWAHYSPQVGGQLGHCDIDLAGTEAYWRGFLDRSRPVGEAVDQARLIAARGQAYCRRRLHLPCQVGIGSSLLVARLAARQAREQSRPVLDATAASTDEAGFIAQLPLHWLPQLSPSQHRQLRDCGLRTIGELALLDEHELGALLGATGRQLAAALQGSDGEVVPTVSEPEPCISRDSDLGAGGADPLLAQRLLQRLARELGFALRDQGLACTRLELDLRWLDGRSKTSQRRLPLACQHDDELERESLYLLHAGNRRRVHLDRLRLKGLGLCPAEEQTVLFDPARRRRLQGIRDRLRRRFGDEVVVTAAPLGQIGDE